MKPTGANSNPSALTVVAQEFELLAASVLETERQLRGEEVVQVRRPPVYTHRSRRPRALRDVVVEAFSVEREERKVGVLEVLAAANRRSDVDWNNDNRLVEAMVAAPTVGIWIGACVSLVLMICACSAIHSASPNSRVGALHLFRCYVGEPPAHGRSCEAITTMRAMRTHSNGRAYEHMHCRRFDLETH